MIFLAGFGQKRVKSNNELNDTMHDIYIDGLNRGKVVQLVKLFQRDYLKRGVRRPRQILEINVGR